MPTSRKKTKVKILGVLLGLSCFIAGCDKPSVIVDSDLETINTIEEVEIDKNLLNVKVSPIQDSPVFRIINNELVEVGIVKENTHLDLSDEVFKDSIRIKDSDLYVQADNLKISERWYEKRNHLIPFNQNIKTANPYNLYDGKGNLVLTIRSNDDYQLYILKNDDNRYGISFQNEILYIDDTDVESIYDNLNSDVAKGESLAVLMYHFFYSEANGEVRKDVNFVEVNELDEQLDRLQEENYVTLSMIEVYEFMQKRANIPLKSVAITIDDGDPSVYKYAYPIIQEHHMNATLFLITGQEDPTLSYDYIEMREAGLELQSHSWQMHQGGCPGQGHGGRLLCIDYETGVNDTRMSFDYVDGGFVYCYPFGDVNEQAKNIIRDGGAKMAFTTVYGKISPGMDLLELPRIRVTGGNSIETYMKSID